MRIKKWPANSESWTSVFVCLCVVLFGIQMKKIEKRKPDDEVNDMRFHLEKFNLNG